jgi:hypothetical protein
MRGDPSHGTRTRYACPYRCRCQPCTGANTAYLRAYRKVRRALALARKAAA